MRKTITHDLYSSITWTLLAATAFGCGGVGLPKNADLGLGAGIANTDDDIVNKICHFGAKVIKLQVFFNLMHRFIFGSVAF